MKSNDLPSRLQPRLYPVIAFLFFMIISAGLKGQTSTKGTEFWFGFMENLNLAHNNTPSFQIIVSAEEATSGKVSMPLMNFEMSFSIGAGEVKEIDLASTALYAQGSDVISKFGIHVVTKKPISIVALHRRMFFTESSIIYPIGMLGTNYHVLTIADISLAKNPAEFLIVATEDKTEVEINPSATTMGLKGKNTPYEITLQRGETYQVQAVGNLSGTTVKSKNDKKIAFFSGARQMYISDSGCGDKGVSADNHLYEATLADQFADTHFVFVPLALRKGDVISILALYPNTKTYIDNKEVKTLYSNSFDTTLRKPAIISSNKPIMVAQFSKSSSCQIYHGPTASVGDPSMFYIIPSRYGSRLERFSIPKDLTWNFTVYPNTWHFINIITPTIDVPAFRLQGGTLISEFKSIGNSNFSYATIQLLPGHYNLYSDKHFLAYQYGFGFFDAYTNALGFETDRTDESNPISATVFPNPVTDKVKVIFNIPDKAPRNIQIDIYDAVSKNVFSTMKTITYLDYEFETNLEYLSKAVYFLRIKFDSGDAPLTYRLIKLER